MGPTDAGGRSRPGRRRLEERLEIAMAWDTYAKENVIDYEYRHKRNKEVRIEMAV